VEELEEHKVLVDLLEVQVEVEQDKEVLLLL
jgi:hypothetical protein